MSCHIPTPNPRLLGYWSFDDAQLTDNSGNGHTATAEGVPGYFSFTYPVVWLPPCDFSGVSGSAPVPTGLEVSPNPATVGTALRIGFAQPGYGTAVASVCDASGRIVRELVRPDLRPGRQELRWDGMTATGSPAAPGVYFVTLRGPGLRGESKAVLVR